MHKLISAFIIGAVVGSLIGGTAFAASNLAKQLAGRILLQVEDKGQAWYVDPVELKRYSLGSPVDCLNLLQKKGLGITNQNLMDIPVWQQNETANWKIYENKEIGIRFKYPSEYGDFAISIDNGETGKKYTGGFQKNGVFSIGGITEDYTAGRSGYFLDFVKYLSESGKYYHFMALGKKFLVEPYKILNVDGQKVLIVNGNSYVDERNTSGPTINPGHNGGALINLLGDGDFKGIAIQNSDIKILPQTKFEEIVETFKFTSTR